MTATQKAARKQALKRSSDGRFARKEAKLTTNRRTRATETAKKVVARAPRVSQRVLKPSTKKALASVELTRDTAVSRSQWIAIGAVANLAALAAGLITGWFLGVA